MKPGKWVIYFAILSGMFLSNMGLSLAAGEKATEPQALAVNENEFQWVWGEVVAVDPTKSELSVKYLDYESDTEKQMTLSVDEKTTYENVKSLSEIKPQDTVSIDYSSPVGGKNIARNVSVEKPEATPAMEEPAAVKEEPKAAEAAAPQAQDQPAAGAEQPKAAEQPAAPPVAADPSAKN